jgi:mono/diheme cytochrome c family protein
MRAIILVSAASVILVAACAGQPVDDINPYATGSTAASSGAGGATTGVGPGPGSSGANMTTGSSGPDGRAFFEMNVSPFLDDQVTGAACANCHSSQYADPYAAPDFLGSSPATFYDFLVGDILYVNATPASSKFLTRGLHTGPAFTGPQAQLVTEWLEIEALRFVEPGTTSSSTGMPPPPGLTGEELLEQFSNCMTLDDWVATGMEQVALNGTLQNGNCYTCHESGVGANYMINPISQAAIADGFNLQKNMPFLQNLVTYEVDPVTGQATSVVQSYRLVDKGGEGTAHPKYLLNAQYKANLDAWFELVNGKLINGECL